MFKFRDTCLSEVCKADEVFTGIKTQVTAQDESVVSQATKEKLAATFTSKRLEVETIFVAEEAVKDEQKARLEA